MHVNMGAIKSLHQIISLWMVAVVSLRVTKYSLKIAFTTLGKYERYRFVKSSLGAPWRSVIYCYRNPSASSG